ncbi:MULTISPECIES: polysaccharide deacetylase family protein [Nitrosomonas]|uniref:Polysaccharide deacetylase n=1 Tax=Nitrosomonas halophila TaxID=44576 RepID=A0A1H3I4G5_9PROT|nr:hypothetical protein [Nitrosomonas halophila]SDY22365.1 hypothetical protein SAMN05421881_10245 [Nitrosomonas halophila]
MLNVFLTVDTEIWPYAEGWPVHALSPDKTTFDAEIAACLYGRTLDGDFGLPYQIEQLNQHGLKATYFLEPLFADRAGSHHLAALVQLIQENGQEVQLHLHTEWLSEIQDPSIPAHFRQYMHQFTLDEQTALIAKGVRSLQTAGVAAVHAFRAGSYGANQATLRAAARNGLLFDTSCNPCYLGRDCQIDPGRPMLQPFKMEDVWEFPVSFFQDYPGHRRHAQLAACSFDEMKTALLDAWKAGWHAFVIVLHSFELVKNRTPAALCQPDKRNIDRFHKLCQFLAGHPDKFRTAQFSEMDPAAIPGVEPAQALRSRPHHTAWRYAEQALSRFV